MYFSKLLYFYILAYFNYVVLMTHAGYYFYNDENNNDKNSGDNNSSNNSNSSYNNGNGNGSSTGLSSYPSISLYFPSISNLDGRNLSTITFSSAAEFAGETWRGWTKTIEAQKKSIWAYLTSIPRMSRSWYDNIRRVLRRFRGKEICYVHLGCFSTQPPFQHHSFLPQNLEELNVKFLINGGNRKEPDGAAVLSGEDIYTNRSLIASKIEPLLRVEKVAVLIHGFLNTGDEPWLQHMVKAFFRRSESVAVVRLGWKTTSPHYNYLQAAANTRAVGVVLAHFLHSILKTAEAKGVPLSPGQFHLIGHSLGGHIAGFAGKHLLLNESSRGKIGRITGLDPAQPLFWEVSPLARLNRKDANFVDVIHTNGVPFSLQSGGFGLSGAIGDLDFYPNGGLHQPGCDGGVRWISDSRFRFCSHGRAVDYFIESLDNNNNKNNNNNNDNNNGGGTSFPSVACENYEKFKSGGCKDCFRTRSCIPMGIGASPPTIVWDSSQMMSSPKAVVERTEDPSIKLFLDTFSSFPYTGRTYINIRLRLTSNEGKSRAGQIFVKIGKGKDAIVYRATNRTDFHALRPNARVESLQLVQSPEQSPADSGSLRQSSADSGSLRLSPADSGSLRQSSAPFGRISSLSLSFVSSRLTPPAPVSWLRRYRRPNVVGVDTLEVFLIDFATNSNRAIFYSNRPFQLAHRKWEELSNSKDD